MFHDPVFEVGRNQHVLEKPAHHDEVHAGVAAGAENGVAELLGRLTGATGFASAARHDQCGDAGVSRDRQAAGVRVRRDDQRDLDRQLTGVALRDQIAQRRPPAGDQHRDPKWTLHECDSTP